MTFTPLYFFKSYNSCCSGLKQVDGPLDVYPTHWKSAPSSTAAIPSLKCFCTARVQYYSSFLKQGQPTATEIKLAVAEIITFVVRCSIITDHRTNIGKPYCHNYFRCYVYIAPHQHLNWSHSCHHRARWKCVQQHVYY